MRSPVASTQTATLRRAALRAIRAPSIHNSQPWDFVLSDDCLEIHADPSRRLEVLDPRGRQLMISCGCAVLNARVAIAADGYAPVTQLFPDPANPNNVARVRVGPLRPAGREAALDRVIERRRTNRRAFMGAPVPASLVRKFAEVVAAEGAVLVPITSNDHRAAVTELTELAASLENQDPRYLAEILAWTTDDPRKPDGVQAGSAAYVGTPDAVVSPIRSFDPRGMGWLPMVTEFGPAECLLLLCSDDDSPASWVRAGQALERLWLEITDRGYWASPLTQVIEVREAHDRLCDELRLTAYPQVMLRVGNAPEAFGTPRRHPDDVIIEI
ncbi:MAG: hypothetical protein QOJ34_551 [Pseudonocardiales bacterium]|nr:hypothetical protein [Pseudonocardiales bacterium]